MHPRNRLAKLEKMLKDEVEYLKTVPLRPRDRLALLKKTLKDELKYLETTPSHPRDKLMRKVKKDAVKL